MAPSEGREEQAEKVAADQARAIARDEQREAEREREGSLTGQLKERLHARVDGRDFRYHAPSPNQVPVYNELRDRARQLAHHFIDVCPVGRELSEALTNLETAVMFANAAVARGEG